VFENICRFVLVDKSRAQYWQRALFLALSWLKVGQNEIHDASLVYRLMDVNMDGKITMQEFAEGV